jgi:excisionase family DNA binding protein
MPIQSRGWLTKREAENYLGVSRKWIERHMASGDIPFSRIDRRIFIRIRDIDRYLQSKQVII